MFSLSASDDTPPYMYEQSVSWYVVMFFKNVRVLMSSASTFASQMLGGRFSFLIILGLVSYDREWPRVSSSESERLLNEPLRLLDSQDIRTFRSDIVISMLQNYNRFIFRSLP
ncbi:hypothetical protein Tco_0918399 [Tanacetum coccineum]